MTKQKTIQFIIDKHDESIDGPLSSYLSTELTNIYDVQHETQSILSQQSAIRQRAKKKSAELDQQHWQLQETCRHWNTEEHNDVYEGLSYYCADCRLFARRIEQGRRVDTSQAPEKN